MQLLRLALRNLVRNTRRSLITGVAVAFGVVALVVLQGFLTAATQNVYEQSVLSRVGAVQVYKAGYLGADDPLKLNFAENPQLVAKLRGIRGVSAVAPRLDFDGMVSNGTEATMFSASAIDPALEYRVCPRRAKYVAEHSRPLGLEDAHGALFGKAIADSLHLTPGATVVLQAVGPHAAVNALDASVVGLLPSLHPSESKRVATVELPFAQELLHMKGRVTHYVLGVEDANEVDAIASKVKRVVGPAYQVTTWREIDQLSHNRTRMFALVFGFIAFILFCLVATGIANTAMMSVHERTREIGTLMAIGVRRRQVSWLFLWEATLLAAFSAVLGAGIGTAILRYLCIDGVSAGPPGGEKVLMFPHVGVGFLLGVITFTSLGTIVSALYPAWKAARLQPVEALRAT